MANISPPEESTLLIFSPLWLFTLHLAEANKVILWPLGTSDKAGKRTYAWALAAPETTIAARLAGM